MFYAYMYPEPDGFRSAPVRPTGAAFDLRLGEFVLPYDVVRLAAEPDAAAQEFFQSAYEAGADLGGWDRPGLEPAVLPIRPIARPWSMMDSVPPFRKDPDAVVARPDSISHVHRHGSRHGGQPDH